MTQSLAAIFNGSANQLSLEHFPVPSPADGEIVVRVLGCTLCASDLHSFECRRGTPIPTVLGHEIVGEIEDIGLNAPATDLGGQPLRVGDRVTWAVVASCGKCFNCLHDLPQKCQHAVKYGHESTKPGRELLGGLAEHCLLTPGTAIVRLPDDLPLEAACPASCATATVAAALEASGPVADGTVCIFGVGMLGLTASAMARSLGARTVLCIDPDEHRRNRALQFGATAVTDPASAKDLTAKLTDGRGFDSVLELSGSPQAFDAGWPMLRIGGTLVLVGAVFPTRAVEIVPEQIIRRQMTIQGVHNYAPRHLLAAVRFLAESHQRYPFAQMVSEWLPLTQAKEAFARAAQPGAIRVGVRPSANS